METIILELSQTTSDTVYNNGDYLSQLTKEIEIKEGDQISIKNVFVDTTNTSGTQINIDEDLTLELYNGYYITNWETADKTYVDASGTSENNVEGTDFVAMQYEVAPALGTSIFEKITKIEFEDIGTNNKYWGNGTSNFTYLDVKGNQQKFSLTIPKLDGRKTLTYTFDLNTIITSGSLVWTNENKLKVSPYLVGIKTISYSPVTTGDVVFTPYTQKTEITLPKGSYEPQQLATYISEVLSKNGTGTNSLINSTFLKTTISSSGPKDSDLPSGIYFMKNTGNKIFYYDDTSVTDRYYVGTSQIQFNYNSNFNKFEIDFLNMPFYKDANISVDYKDILDNTSTSTGNLFKVSKNSGIFFTALDALDPSGNHVDFWEGKMGFDLNSLCVQIPHNNVLRDFVPLGLSNCHVPLMNLQDGTNVTSGYAGLDTVVQKNADFMKAPSTIDPSTTGQQVSIIAAKDNSSLTINSSHFLLDLKTGFKNRYVNSINITNTISGIINRYYGYASFTSGGAEVSIPYIHVGEPLILSSVAVRILNPDFSTPQDLGEENVVYIQITRQVEQIEQQQQKQQKK